MQRRNFMIRSLSATTAALALGALAPAQSALAADAGWPTAEPIRLIVPFPPGGTADVVNRLFAQQLGKVLGASVIVENKAGAGGSLGTRFVADAKPDGYTLLGASAATTFFEVTLPGAVPVIFSGLRLGLIYALLGVVGTEIIASEKGLGQTLAYLGSTFDINGVMALLLVLALLGVGMVRFMSWAERRLLHWQ